MTNGGTQRAPCVGRTDMTYRRKRSGRSASTHGWYPEAKTPGTGAMTGDEPCIFMQVSGLSDSSDLSAAGRTAKAPRRYWFCPTCPTEFLGRDVCSGV